MLEHFVQLCYTITIADDGLPSVLKKKIGLVRHGRMQVPRRLLGKKSPSEGFLLMGKQEA